jgi:hypothetical protein
MTNPRCTLFGVVALLGLLGLTGCPSSNPEPSSSAAQADPDRAQAEGPSPKATASPDPDFPLPTPWPPRKGAPYPDVELQDHTGRAVKISDFRGKVVLVEPIGMNCPGCQAFVGGHGPRGPYGGGRPQPGIQSIEELLEEYGETKLDDPGLVHVHLLLYDMSSRRAPTLADAKAWAEHWGLDEQPNAVVLRGNPNYVCKASYDLVPGFQLIDAQGVLRSDSTGHHAQDDLYRELLPMVRPLLEEAAEAGGDAEEASWYPDDITPPEGTRYPCALTALPADLVGVPAEERRFVERVYAMILSATQAKLLVLRSVREDRDDQPGRLSAYLAATDEAVERIEAEPTPQGLKTFRGKVAEAIRLQQAFFRAAVAARASGQSFEQVLKIPSGRKASKLLISAWGDMTRRYPRWDAATKDSIYHHLCALDLF